MNPERTPGRTAIVYIFAILGSFLIIGGMVWAMRAFTRPAPLGEARAAERAKALAELHASEAEALEHPGWVDPTKGIVRLPISVAMDMVLREWGQNPAAGRKDLIARVEKATVPPPKAPEKPSPFE
ncbi:MAG TPA: hypothetical protein VG167_13135 [Verrucomicrobiae bacterium]|nr:hypothetical protein [Verrucomicrobiae bacterium]